MSGWTITYYFVNDDVEIDMGSRNVSGSAFNSATRITERDEGYAVPLAGVYRFTMATSSTVSCSIVHSHDTGNPQAWSGTKSVTCDGSTENLNLVPGVAVVLNAAAGAGDIFEIGIGCYWSAGSGSWVRVLPRGPALPGFATSEIELKAENESLYTQASSKVVATNAARVENGQTASRPFYSFRQTGTLNPTAHDDLLGVAITFANVSGGTADILVDGEEIDIYDLTNSQLVVDGIDLQCDGAHVYKFADGTALQSIEFMLSDELSSGDTATIYVSDGGESVELANVGEDFVAGPTGIDLTETGQATGSVTSGKSITFRLRLKPGASEDTDLNPRAFSLRVSSTKV